MNNGVKLEKNLSEKKVRKSVGRGGEGEGRGFRWLVSNISNKQVSNPEWK